MNEEDLLKQKKGCTYEKAGDSMMRPLSNP